MRFKTNSPQSPNGDEIPLLLTGFLLSDETRLERFLALTGITRDDLETRVNEPDFQAFVLDYALEDQSLVLEFALAHDLKPEALLAARRRLPGAFY